MTFKIEKYIFFIIFFLFFNFTIYSNDDFKNIENLIDNKSFSKAQTELLRLKNISENQNILPVINYFLGKIDYLQDKKYSALYFIELALNDKSFDNLDDDRKIEISFWSSAIYFKAGLYSKSFEKLEELTKTKNKFESPINLYLSDWYLNKKYDFYKAQSYFIKIRKRELSEFEIKLYHTIYEKLGWDRIDTELFSSKDPNVNCLAIKNYDIFIGLWNGGLYKYDINSMVVKNYSYKLPSPEIRDILVSNDNIYAGTSDGLTTINLNTNFVKNDLKGKAITCISENKEKLFIGTLRDGLIIYDKKRLTYSTFAQKSINSISSIFFSNAGLFVSTYNQNFFLIKNNRIISLHGKPKSVITGMIEIGNKLWISTYGEGLYSFDIKSKTFKKYSLAENKSLEENFCISIAEDNEKLYCGTLGKGIIIFNTQTFLKEKFNIPAKFKGTDIKNILVTQDFIFFASLGEGILKKIVQKN